MLLSKEFDFNEFIEKYLDEPLVHSFCKSCENYNLNYSCPVHCESLIEKYRNYKYITIFIYKDTYDQFVTHEDAYWNARNFIDKAIFDFEKETNSIGLIPGKCMLCNPCLKTLDEPCPTPELIRHSLETIGFHVSNIIENEFDEKLEWDTRILHLVFGALSNKPITAKFDDFIKFYI